MSDDERECYEGDPKECRAMSGGTAHSACAHCGVEVGCVPVLLFKGEGDATEMYAVCDDCLGKHYVLGSVERAS